MLNKVLLTTCYILGIGFGLLNGATYPVQENSGSTQKNSFVINSKGLSLYKVLIDTRQFILEDSSDEPDENTTENKHRLLALVDKEMSLLEEIIAEFEKGKYLFFQIKFISLCNYFKKLGDDVEPRHLRTFSNLVGKFDESIQKYLTERKNIISKDEAIFLENIHQFNEILISNFLEYKYFNIDVFDRIIDWTVYKPIDLIKRHPASLACIAVPVAFGLGLYAYNNNSSLPTTLDSRSIKMEPSVEPQRSAMCGKHALMNVACQINSDINKDENKDEKTIEWGDFLLKKMKAEYISKKARNPDAFKIDTVNATVEPYIVFFTELFSGGLTSYFREKDDAKKEEYYKFMCDLLLQIHDNKEQQERLNNIEDPKSLLNSLEGEKITWIHQYEKEKDERWNNVFIVEDTQQIHQLTKPRNVSKEEVNNQLLAANEFIKENRNKSLEERKKLRMPEIIDADVWRHCIRPILDKKEITDVCTFEQIQNELKNYGMADAFSGLVEKLRGGERVFYIINLASRVRGDKYVDSYGHWVACRDDANGFAIRNSTGWDLTQNPYLQDLFRFGHYLRTGNRYPR